METISVPSRLQKRSQRNHYNQEYIERKELEQSYKIRNRGLGQYLSGFNLDIEDLKGKKILDEGSGFGNFAKEGRPEGLDIVSLDLSYATKKGRSNLKKNIGDEQVPAIASVAQKLPFKDGKFDVLINNYSALNYAENSNDIWEIVNEALRVLKVGGEYYIRMIEEDSRSKTGYRLDFPENCNESLSDYFFEVLEYFKKKKIIEYEVREQNRSYGCYAKIVKKKDFNLHPAAL